MSTAWVAGALVQFVGPRPVFLMMACFPLLIGVAALFIDEKKIMAMSGSSGGVDVSSSSTSSSSSSSKFAAVLRQAKALLSALLQPSIFGPAVFIFCYGAPPRAGSAMFYFYTNELKFSPEFIGRINLLDGAAQLAGVALFNAKLKGVALRKIFFNVILIGAAASFLTLVLVSR